MENHERDNFKLIALSILPGCKDSIRKCLKEGILYYFCNDYIIDSETNSRKLRSKNLTPLDPSFFEIDNENSHPVVNISAIVGKNGDGKSTLVEVLLRLINNFVYRYSSKEKTNLLYVKGVRASLYYQIGTRLFVLKESSLDNKKGSTIQLIELGENETRDVTDESEFHSVFFHTIVSNYSHYAYNAYDYMDEWDSTAKSKMDEDKCWIHRLTSSDYAFQTPITVFPYRERGGININSEIDLAKQRFIALVLSDNSDKGPRYLGNKVAEYIELRKAENSKFLLSTIIAYFLGVKEENLLNDEISFLKSVLNKDILSEKELQYFQYSIYYPIMHMYRKFFRKNKTLTKAYFQWQSGFDFKLTSEKSDLAQLIDVLVEILSKCKQKSFIGDLKPAIDEICYYFRPKSELKKQTNPDQFNILQLQRFEIVSEVYELWRMRLSFKEEVDSLFKDYDELTEAERCIHYLVYKTISIFQKQEEYGFPIISYEREAVLFEKRSWMSLPYISKKREKVNRTLMEAFKKLQEDLLHPHGHFLLKLSQTVNYYHDLKINSPFEEVLDSEGTSYRYKLDQLECRGLDLSKLPPPLFSTAIVFRDLNDNSIISLSSLSSGEKQRLFTLSSVLYHIKSVDALSSGKYINVIFEEIELYFHPESQRSFIYKLLQSLIKLELKNIRAINFVFVTHSPFILSDIPLTNVLFLEDGRPVNNMQENTFGSNINGLLKNGFFLPKLPIGEFAYNKISGLFRKVSINDYLDEEWEKVRQEILLIGEPYLRNELLKLMRPMNK